MYLISTHSDPYCTHLSCPYKVCSRQAPGTSIHFPSTTKLKFSTVKKHAGYLRTRLRSCSHNQALRTPHSYTTLQLSTKLLLCKKKIQQASNTHVPQPSLHFNLISFLPRAEWEKTLDVRVLPSPNCLHLDHTLVTLTPHTLTHSLHEAVSVCGLVHGKVRIFPIINHCPLLTALWFPWQQNNEITTKKQQHHRTILFCSF